MIEDVVFVENKDSDDLSLKKEFLNKNSQMYTISIGTLTLNRHDPINFFKTYGLTNAVAYKFGDNKEFARVISGIYKTGTEAANDIKNLDPRLQKNRPYSAKLIRHQKLFSEYNGEIQSEKVIKMPTNKRENKITINEGNNSIFISGSENSKKLKKEFLKKGSKYYSIALGTMSSNQNTINNFLKKDDVSDKALAHLYGKNKDKVRIIYGLYKTREEAKKAIESFTKELKSNAPYAMNMKKFQSFYSKSFPNKINNEEIVELKIQDKKQLEQKVIPKLSNNIKIVQSNKSPKKDLENFIKKEQKKIQDTKTKVVKKKEIIKKPIKKKTVVKKTKKIVKKVNPNKNRFLKHSKLEDVYFLESNGEFNILNEVFLNDGSSFYTVDLGELKLDDTTIEEFFIQNNIENDAVSYKYGDKKEFARVIYGAYETKEDASEIAKELNVSSKNIRVSNIKNHQKLYKEFHKNIKKKPNKKEIAYKDNNSDIVYTISNNRINKLKEEFFNPNSSFYTITLSTFLKEDIKLEDFLIKNNLKEDTLAYSIGSANNYYRVIYGAYKTRNEVLEVLDNLSNQLKRNVPYISRVNTNQKKYKSYNNRSLKNIEEQALKIEF